MRKRASRLLVVAVLTLLGVVGCRRLQLAAEDAVAVGASAAVEEAIQSAETGEDYDYGRVLSVFAITGVLSFLGYRQVKKHRDAKERS